MSHSEIPLNRARLFGNEEKYVTAAMRSGRVSSGGPFGERCVDLLEAALGGPRVLLTSSCTHALEMAALLLELRPGDVVLVPSFAYVATAEAFALHGARPVFVDVEEGTFNLDVADVERKMTARTRAVVALHYGGVGSEVDALGALCERHGAVLIEDNAHGLFGTYHGRSLGSLGALAALSFHATKSVTCGKGGALLVNDDRYLERALRIRAKGTDQAEFEAGRVAAYTWVDHGSNYSLSELQAAYLLGQLEEREAIAAHRRALWDRYHAELETWSAAEGVRRPVVPAHCTHAHLLYYLVLPTDADRAPFIAHLAARGIQAAFHYPPLHLSRMGRDYGGRPGDCPTSERVSARLVRLPLNNAMTATDQTRVIEAVLAFSRATA